MASDWGTFKDNLKAEFASPNEMSISDLANLIADEYETAVKAGGDSISNNSIATYNKPALASSLEAMFTLCAESNVIMDLNIVSAGLVLFWTGCVLTTTGLAPGTTSTVSALVIAPGVPVPIPPPTPSDSPDNFVNFLETFFKTHLTTVTGMIIGMVPGSPPVATPFPFVGYL